MSLAENLLNSLPEKSYATPLIAGDAIEEEHIVVNENRKIIVPDSLKVIAVEGDKDVETVTIDCIRYWDEHDLSTFRIYVKCELPNRDEVTYIPKTLSVKENYFSFDWVIGREITPYVGKLKFWIVAKIVDDNGDDVYQWSSLQNDECSVARGGGEIYVTEVEEEKDAAIQDINQIREIVEEGDGNAGNSTNSEEEHILVGNKREISVPENLKVIAVKGDKNVETVTIDCIRWWDNHDLSTFAVYINYKNANGDNGTYIPKKLIVKENIFSFDWIIGRHISSYIGRLTFWIVAKITDYDGNIVHQWSSLQNYDCKIKDGGDKIYVPEEQTDKDVISQAISVSTQSAKQAQDSAKLAYASEEAAKSAQEKAEEAARLAQESVGKLDFETDHTLSYENGVLSVNTVDDIDDDKLDKTLPITASAVEKTVGNISALLDII